MGIKEETIKMKAAAPYLAASSVEQRNKALLMVAENLRANAAKIFEENKRDLAAAEEDHIAQAVKIDVSQVNVKATTEEGLGFTGSEDGISSQAICAISSIYENSIAVGGSERNCAGCPGCGK